MRQRVAIALALCADSCLLIADEPTTALDVSVQAQIIALLRRLCRQRGLSAMLITHDMGVIAETADRVMVMYGGRVLETGPVRQVLQNPRHRYTRALMAAIPSVTRRQHRLPVPGVATSSAADGGSFPQSLSGVGDSVPQWQAQPPKAVESASAADQSEEADAGTPLLAVENLSRRFDLSSGWLQRLLSREPRRILQAVDNVGFTITRGRTFGLVGESGSGKSTVARMVAGLLKPDSGRIAFEGVDRWSRDAARLPTEQRLALRRRCQMIFQDPYASLNPRWRAPISQMSVSSPALRSEPRTVVFGQVPSCSPQT